MHSIITALTTLALFGSTSIPVLAIQLSDRETAETNTETIEKNEIERRVDEYVRPYVEMNHFAGTILVAKGEEVLVHRSWGFADRQLEVPFSTEIRTRVGSITKDFSNALALKLQDEGLLSLTDSVARFLPEFEHGDKIRISHLLNHTHGVPSWRSLPDAAALETSGISLADATAVLGDYPLQFEPGTERRYGSSGHLLLARVIEVATQTTYANALREYILRPLGLNETGSMSGLEIVRDLAAAYVPANTAPWLKRAKPTHPSITQGSASVYSTAHDLFVWSRSDLAGRIGWGQATQHDRPMLWTSGLTAGFVARVHRFPNEDVTLILMSNIFSPTFRPVLHDIAAIVFGDKVNPPTVWHPAELTTGQKKVLTGTWECDAGIDEFTIDLEGDALVFDVGGSRSPLIPRAYDKLFLPTDYAVLTFSHAPDGLPVTAHYDGGFSAQCTPAE